MRGEPDREIQAIFAGFNVAKMDVAVDVGLHAGGAEFIGGAESLPGERGLRRFPAEIAGGRGGEGDAFEHADGVVGIQGAGDCAAFSSYLVLCSLPGWEGWRVQTLREWRSRLLLRVEAFLVASIAIRFSDKVQLTKCWVVSVSPRLKSAASGAKARRIAMRLRRDCSPALPFVSEAAEWQIQQSRRDAGATISRRLLPEQRGQRIGLQRHCGGHVGQAQFDGPGCAGIRDYQHLSAVGIF